MYFPYLFGKLNEFAALSTCLDVAPTAKRIPIVEPVRLNSRPLIKAAKAYNAHAQPILIITNPSVGEIVGSDIISRTLTSGDLSGCSCVIPTFRINPYTTIPDVIQFVQMFSNRSIALVHVANHLQPSDILRACSNVAYHVFTERATTEQYRDAFTGTPRVIINCPFVAKARNADYCPPKDQYSEELYSDRVFTFQRMGFQGFGDYTIMGDDYTESGGPAHSVAIHLTRPNHCKEIRIHHFVSNDNGSPANTPGKFLQAVEKLCNYVKTNPDLAFSHACRSFQDLHARQHFPGLGTVKQLSIQHHLELMNDLM